MYDKNDKIINFFERTYENLEKYKKLNKDDKENYPYEVTMIVNSLLGLLVFIKENKKAKLEEFQVDDLIAKQKIETKKSRKEFLRHMRNAVAHGNFEVNANDNGEIDCITFYDKYYQAEKKSFEITLTIADMEHLISELRIAVREYRTIQMKGE